jgi:hypothetical protein
MTEDKECDVYRPRRVKELAEDIAELCDGEQKHHAQKAQEFGYARDVLNDIKDIYVHIPCSEPLLKSAEDSLIKFRNFIEAKKGAQGSYTDISSIAYFLGTSTAVTGSAIDPTFGIFKTYNIPQPPSFWPRDRLEQYASQLDKLNLELGTVYRSIRSSLYGNEENPERAAMY